MNQLLWFFPVSILFLAYMTIRNNAVCAFRLNLNDEWYRESRLAIRDWDNYRPIPHPCDTLPSYNKMLWQFWVWPLNRFAKRDKGTP